MTPDFWFGIVTLLLVIMSGGGIALWKIRQKAKALANLLNEIADALEDEKITREEIERIIERVRTVL